VIFFVKFSTLETVHATCYVIKVAVLIR